MWPLEDKYFEQLILEAQTNINFHQLQNLFVAVVDIKKYAFSGFLFVRIALLDARGK